jgi:hypothetical protein
LNVPGNEDVIKELISAAADLAPEQFVNEHLFTDRAFIFDWDGPRFVEFRTSMEQLLEVEPGQVGLIGSAKLGYSLNPEHLLRRFRPESDIDLVVVAPDLFDECVLELRQRSSEIQLAGVDERRRLRKTREHIPDGFLRPDQLPMACGLMKKWFPRLAGPFENEPAKSHSVKAWLFKSWELAKLCYTEHHSKIQSTVRLMRERSSRREA